MGSFPKFVVFTFLILCLNAIASTSSFSSSATTKHTNNWAILVCTSRFWLLILLSFGQLQRSNAHRPLYPTCSMVLIPDRIVASPELELGHHGWCSADYENVDGGATPVLFPLALTLVLFVCRENAQWLCKGIGALTNLLTLSSPLALSSLAICSVLPAIFMVYGRDLEKLLLEFIKVVLGVL